MPKPRMGIEGKPIWFRREFRSCMYCTPCARWTGVVLLSIQLRRAARSAGSPGPCVGLLALCCELSPFDLASSLRLASRAARSSRRFSYSAICSSR